MTVKLIFKNDVTAQDLDKSIFPDPSGHVISVSDSTTNIDRHDLKVGDSGKHTWVKIVGVRKNNLSSETMNSIKSVVPTDHIRTENV